MDFHGGANGTIIFCSAFLLFAQNIISSNRERVRLAKGALKDEAVDVVKTMGDEKDEFPRFEIKLKDYDNLLAHDSAEFLEIRVGFFVVLVGTIFIQALLTASDLYSIDYSENLAKQNISLWAINTGRALFVLQIVVALISAFAIALFRKEGLGVNSFVGRTEKFVYEAKEVIDEFESMCKSSDDRHKKLFRENENLKEELENLRKEKRKADAEERLGGRPASRDDLRPNSPKKQ